MKRKQSPALWLVSGNGPEVPDGVAHYTQRLLETLAARKPEWRWYWLHRRARRLGLPIAASGGVIHVQPDHTWGPRGRLLASAAIRLARPTLVHVQEQIHSFHETHAACELAAAARCPLAVTLHEFHTELPSKAITAELARKASFLAANDRRTAERCFQETHRPVDEVWWSPSNVLPSAEALSAPKRAGLVVTFGQINAIRSYSALRDALRELRTRHPALRWRIVGPFDPRTNLEHARVASELGEPWIEFTGGSENLDDPSFQRSIAEAEIMALPFADGASPRRTTLQAGWAFGLPVVTTPPQVLEPAISDGQNALLARDAAPSWAEALGRLLDDPALRARLSAGALATVRQFGWERLAELHLKRYETLLSASS